MPELADKITACHETTFVYSQSDSANFDRNGYIAGGKQVQGSTPLTGQEDVPGLHEDQ